MSKAKDPARITNSITDTIRVTPEIVKAWRNPPFQRECKANWKVRELSREIAHSKVLPGAIHLGVLDGKTYLVDGQHRIAAFLMAEIEEGYCDVITCRYATMGDMGKAFVALNSALRRFGPDDLLRGMESSEDGTGLALLRKRCPFIGYDSVRRGDNARVMLSASSALRCWIGGRRDTPSNAVGSSADMLCEFDTTEAKYTSDFYESCFHAWGREVESRKMWLALTTTLSAWLYHRLVLGRGMSTLTKTKTIDIAMFRKCLMSLSADAKYAEWAHGRTMNERDRSPAYNKVKAIFASRILAETGVKAVLPQPEWAH